VTGVVDRIPGADPSRVPKASERIARALVNYIVDNDLAEGTLLPVERELVEQFGVGRSTLREALRLLETRGVITIRPGRLGGPVVRRPRPEDLGEGLTLQLQFDGSSLTDVMQARQAVEPAIARIAAERITASQLGELEASVQRMLDNLDDRSIFLQENRRFHELIAEASHSNVLRIFTIALKSIADGDSAGVELTRKQRKSVADAHLEIIHALKVGGEAAAKEMSEHLEEASQTWRRYYGPLLDRPVRWLDPLNGVIRG
jgi:GntR family transcriptional regulator, transcriptional repressor for pyruvate dehydrogenase complex